MTNETYGIETLKRAVNVGIALPIQAAKTVKAKFKPWDILAFMDEVRELVEVMVVKEDVIKEFKDLSEEEKAELIAYAKEEFDLPDDDVEFFVENALLWAVSTIQLFKKAKELRAKKA